MKKVFAWIFRIVCFAIIAAAIATVIRSVMHMNDDHSRMALLGNTGVENLVEQSQAPEAVEQENVAAQEQSTLENPSIVLYDSGAISSYHPYTTVTASFGDISGSLSVEYAWLLDGESIETGSEQLVVEGSTLSCNVELDPTLEGPDSETVTLELYMSDGSTLSYDTTITIERVAQDQSALQIKTAEIPVTANAETTVYETSELETASAALAKDDSALLLERMTSDSGTVVLRVQLHDGTTGWVKLEDVTISQDSCTTDQDYGDEEKTEFVNTMDYSSSTEYLVWINLYTQKVNVFRGSQGSWTLDQVFECATGKNDTPTTTGVYTYSELQDQWDLGDTYVKPVLIFNGGEAITSRPYSATTHYITDTTMGSPASGGSVRMREDDVEWMAENLTICTTVVVY